MEKILTGQTKDISLVLKDGSGTAIDLTTAVQIIGYIKHNNCTIAKFCSDDIAGFQTFEQFPQGYGHMHRDLDITGKMVLKFNRVMTTAKEFIINDYVDFESIIWLDNGSEISSITKSFLQVEISDVLRNEYKRN